ncbi:MAG: hypothetical protein AB1832_09660 [Pseudomonadota bacterium]
MEWPLAWRSRKVLARMLADEQCAAQARVRAIVESLEREEAGAGRVMAALSRDVDRHAPRMADLETRVRARTSLRELDGQLEKLPRGAERKLLSRYIQERRRMARGRGRRVLARIGASVLLLAAGMVAWMFWLAAVDA